MQQMKMRYLGRQDTRSIISNAKDILEKEGVEIESKKVKDLLYNGGCSIVKKAGRRYDVVLIPADIVDSCIATVPKCVKMYDRDGNLAANLGGDNVYFNPGSCATNYYDCKEDKYKKPTTKELEEFVRIADKLENIKMQSTAMIVNDIEEEIQDAYRLYIVLKNTTKPVVTGTFSGNFDIMKELLIAVRGSEKELSDKPLAIFDCCPSPALKWAKVWSEDLISCAKAGIPAEFISMPQPGLSSPATIYDSIVQHTAETFSGIVISQLARKGAPLIYGGSPTMINFKDRSCTALLGDIGTAKLDAGYISIAKSLALPCQAYLGLSDSKIIDVQAGFEKGLTLLVAALSGINNVSGPGMLESENCQSKEMLVIDNEICGEVLNFVQGIQKKKTNAAEEIRIMAEEKTVNPESMKYLRQEMYDTELAHKGNLASWLSNKDSMLERAIKKSDYLLKNHQPEQLNEEIKRELDLIIKRIGY